MAKLSVIIDASQAVRGSRQAITAIQNINVAVDNTTRKVDNLERRTGRLGRPFVMTARTISRAMQSATRSVQRLGRMVTSVKSAILSMGTLVAGIAGGLLVTQVVRYADAWQNATNRLRAFTDSQAQAVALQERLFQSSQRTRTPFGETVNLVARMLTSREQTGISISELEKFNETISKTISLSGSTQQEAAGALRQLSQMLANERVRSAGQELASIGEQAVVTYQTLAKGLGVSVGEMRRLAEEGKLTSSELIRGVIRVSDEVDARFATIVPTIGSAFTTLNNAITRTIGLISQATGFGERFAQTIMRAADFTTNLGTLASNASTPLSNISFQAGTPGGTIAADFFQSGTVGKAFVDILIDQVRNVFVPAIGKAMAGAALVFAGSLVLSITRILPQIFQMVGMVAEAFAQALTDAIRKQSVFIDKILGKRSASGVDVGTFGQQLDAVGQATLQAGFAQFAEAGGRVAGSFATIADFTAQVADNIQKANAGMEEMNEKADDGKSTLTLFGKLFEGVNVTARQVGENIGQAFGDAFSNIITGVEDIRDAFANLAQQIFQMLFQAIVASRLQNIFGNLLGNLAGAPSSGGSGTPAVEAANGHAFMGGNVVPFAQGGIIDRMGIFPLSGGKVGVAGEAGPEAMMEVARMPGGKLGVASRGGGGNTYNFNIRVAANNPEEFGASGRQMKRAAERSLRGIGRRS